MGRHTDWDLFRREVSWFPAASVRAAAEPVPFESLGRIDESFATAFPKMSRLLRGADVTRLETKRGPLELLAWDHPTGRRGWLCEPPGASASPVPLHPDHHALLDVFGGITERFNEPESWLMNLNSALAARYCRSGTNGAADHYREACHDRGLAPTVREEDYVAFAFEANGDLTLYHRETSDVILFLHDHSSDDVTPLPGCPDYTFYTRRGAVTLRDWVENVAAQWLASFEPAAE